jgi:hypothetical protein
VSWGAIAMSLSLSCGAPCWSPWLSLKRAQLEEGSLKDAGAWHSCLPRNLEMTLTSEF